VEADEITIENKNKSQKMEIHPNEKWKYKLGHLQMLHVESGQMYGHSMYCCDVL
jgi:hypothetical protein